MENPKVSLIVPCYNIASVCDRFFESLLSQTYDNIEIVLVNDGSTDNTEEKLLFYKEKLENRGFEVKYIYQENKGLGGAINTGLKAFTGDFLCWADPDDYYEDNSFELRVQYMQEHPECAVVTSDAYVRNGDKTSLVSHGFPKTKEKKQFKLLLKAESIFCPGCHMIRTTSFEKVNPERDIYEYRRGQNWQMLLPVYYEFERYFLNVPLYNYIVYSNSMSHIKETYEQKKTRLEEHQDVIIKTICRMNIDNSEKKRIQNKAKTNYLKILMNLSYYNSNKLDFKYYFHELLKHGKISIKDCTKFVLINFKK